MMPSNATNGPIIYGDVMYGILGLKENSRHVTNGRYTHNTKNIYGVRWEKLEEEGEEKEHGDTLGSC